MDVAVSSLSVRGEDSNSRLNSGIQSFLNILGATHSHAGAPVAQDYLWRKRSIGATVGLKLRKSGSGLFCQRRRGADSSTRS